jgi:pimeloyl-ACP methyl ester carboxylesterase
MEVNGKGIAVDVLGGGAPTLMIHGLGETSNVWHAQREVLARSFRVLCPDRSPLKGALSIDGFAADMAAILDPLNIFLGACCGLFAQDHGLPASGSQLPRTSYGWGRLRRRRSTFGSDY